MNRHMRNILLIGAGEAGQMILKELKSISGYRVCALLDDNPVKKGRRIYQVEILGPVDILCSVIRKYEIDEIYITMPSVDRAVVRKVISLLEAENLYNSVVLKILPSFYEIITGTARLHQIKEIDVDDILGRKPVCLDMTKTADFLREKQVLITGAGGSIGSEMCSQILGFSPARMILLGHGENSIFNIYNRLIEKRRELLLDTELIPVIADVRDKQSIQKIFGENSLNAVYHCAAHKHVWLMEENPEEAFENNVIGTMNLAGTAIESGVERFIQISTDKAVYPSNCMGATKRLCEILVQNMPPCRTEFSIVRFGNVLGSRGSVVEIFRNQIRKNLPLFVRGIDTKRYFMTISEASQLVLAASAEKVCGKFILDMGSPVRIYDLAREIIHLSGMSETQIPIIVTEMLDGEKHDEKLFFENELKKTERISGCSQLMFSSFCDSFSDIIKYILNMRAQLSCKTRKEQTEYILFAASQFNE